MRKIVGEFAEREIKPLVRYFDDFGNTKEAQERLKELRRKAGKVGILGMGLPEEYSGVKPSPITLGIVSEEIGRRGGSLILLEPPGIFLAYPIMNWGSKAQKDEYLPRLISGELVSVGLYVTEPGAGSDITAMSTRATREGDNLILNGEKTFVSGAQWDEVAVIACKTNPEGGHRGLSLVIVDLESQGVTRTRLRSMGWHNMELGGVVLKDVRVPASNLIGEENHGFRYMMEAFEAERVYWSCGSLGIAEGSFDETVEFVKQRRQFDRPIGKFEAVQFRMAEAATYLEAAKWFCYRTLWLKENGQSARKESAMLKWWTIEMAYKVVNDMMVNKGAYGFTSDCLDDVRLRELKGASIAGGTADIQKMIIGREILGKEFDPIR